MLTLLALASLATATLYAQENVYRVISYYGEIAVISFPSNDTISERGVTKFRHWIHITPLRLGLWVVLHCNHKAYREVTGDQLFGRNPDGSWITKKVATPDISSVNKPESFSMIDGSPDGIWDIVWETDDEYGNPQNLLVQYQKEKGQSESRHSEEQYRQTLRA